MAALVVATDGGSIATATGSDPRQRVDELAQATARGDEIASSGEAAHVVGPSGWVGGAEGLPDCVPVQNAAGDVVGCARKVEMYADPERAQELVEAHPEGMPVYAGAGSSEIVGFLPGGIGFVPRTLIDRVDELRGCFTEYGAAKSSGDAGQLSPECRQLLTQVGMQRHLP